MELIQAALGDLTHIDHIDQSLAPVDESTFDRSTVDLVRGMYEEWARSAEGLLERIERVERRSGRLVDAEQLRHSHGRIRAMLSFSLDALEQGHYEAQQPGTPIEEVRRELRARV
jgi:hypothetical protein